MKLPKYFHKFLLIFPDLLNSTHDSNIFHSVHAGSEQRNAFTFVVKMEDPSASSSTHLDSGAADKSLSSDKQMHAQFDMASLSYVHSPKFLTELLDCVSEFQDFMTNVASSIKTAATEVAMGMVGVRGESSTRMASVDGSLMFNADLLHQAKDYIRHPVHHDASLEDISENILLEDMSQSTRIASPTCEVKHRIVVNARMESPILVVPRTANSPQVISAPTNHCS